MRLSRRVPEIGCLILGFGFGLFTATAFFPHESTFWLRFVAGGLVPTGLLISVAGRRKQEKDSVDEKHVV
jgi:hypothetical protein